MNKEKHVLIGLMLIILSTLLYIAELYFNIQSKSGPFNGVFFIHYIPAVIYFFIIKFHKNNFWRFFQKDNFTLHTLLLVLFNISAYSLNRSIPVFNESSDWQALFLIIENALLVTYSVVINPSKTFEYIMCFFMTIALIFNIYQMLMILPASPFGILGTPFFGLSLLLFVPIFYIVCIVTLLKSLVTEFTHKVALIGGLILTAVVISVYSFQFKRAESLILQAKLDQDAPFVHDQDLPDWVTVAQVIDDRPLTEKYLKTGLIYQEFVGYDKNAFSSIWRSSIDEKFIHDPLVSIGSIFTKQNALDEMTRIKILNYLYDARHQTSDRFWSGENLKSQQVVTNIELFPEERLSFTEHIITIKNDRQTRGRWRNQQEALYTFDLPNGGVVTSLSLWINGSEKTGILTSKKKAQKAYNTIVGRERRDPSVVYWMEGNKIRVRVFPCTPEEDRKFKVGITSPLSLNGEYLTYSSIGFKGPDYSKAVSAIHVVTNSADIVKSDIDFQESALYYSWEGNYDRDWFLTIDKTNGIEDGFSYKNETFNIEKTIPNSRDYKPKRVYLDVSSNWKESEIKKISKVIEGKEVIVFTTHFKRKNSSNSIVRLGKGSLPTFTLFPFHNADTDQAIVITKGGNATPNLSDLKDTRFKKQLFNYFKNQKNAPLVIDIGLKPSDYMQSLKEFGVIEYHSLSIGQLISCIKKDSFPTINTDRNLIEIPENGLSIKRSNLVSKDGDKASDHLMRLFYYQEVMKEIGNKYFTDDKNEYIGNEIVDKAALANIVTPLSSLIVLETQEDYERFDIKNKTDSLGNASISDAGAVPEPHEWAMIIIGVAFLVFMYRRSKSSITAA